MATFTFQGTEVPLLDIEDMTVDEALDLESARGVGWDDLTDLAKVGALVGFSIYKALPGYTWPAVLKSVPLGTVRQANEALQAEASKDQPAAGDGEVLSPTSAASENEPPAA